MSLKGFLKGKLRQLKKISKEEYEGYSELAIKKLEYKNMLAYEYNTKNYMYGIYMWKIDIPKEYDTKNLVEILDLNSIRFTIDREYYDGINILYIFGNNRSFGIMINALRCGFYKPDIVLNRSLLEEFESYAAIYWITHDGDWTDFISLKDIVKINPSIDTKILLAIDPDSNKSEVNAFDKLAGILVYHKNNLIEDFYIEYFMDQKLKNTNTYNTIVEEENEEFDPSIDEII